MERSLEPGKADKWLEKINKYSKKIQSAPAAAREFGTPKWIWSFCAGHIYIIIYIHAWYMYIYIHMSIPRLYGLTLGPKVLGCSPWKKLSHLPFAYSAPLNRDVIINSCYIFDICIITYSIVFYISTKGLLVFWKQKLTGSWWTRRTF